MYHAIIQARMGSKRLPGKSLMKYQNITPLEVLIKRIKKIKKISQIIIATTILKKDEIFLEYANKLNIKVFRGSSKNVLERYYSAAKFFNSKNIIRLTADCPFIDAVTVNKMINIFNSKKFDYVANTYPLPCTFPDGSDIEIFNFKSLKKNNEEAFLPSDKEHVTKYFWNSKKFKCFRLDCKTDFSKYRYTIDIKQDFNLFKNIIKNNKNFLKLNMKNIVKFIDQNPKLVKYQKKLKRNFGWDESLRQDKLYKNENK
jgi:spore coat polysaccharide biosynthesis protein SpsF (cytidylyltransferase family)